MRKMKVKVKRRKKKNRMMRMNTNQRKRSLLSVKLLLADSLKEDGNLHAKKANVKEDMCKTATSSTRRPRWKRAHAGGQHL